MITLIGAPCDAGANRPGACFGPQALRFAGVQPSLEQTGCSVEDLGDLQVQQISTPVQVPGYRHFTEVLAWNHQVHIATSKALLAGKLPVLLGGDHSLAMGSISAVAAHCRANRKRLRVLWLDAHADFNTAATSVTGNMHGMPLTVLCGLGPRELTHLGGFSPALLPEQVRLLGVRSVDPEEKHALRRASVPVLSMRRIQGQGIVRTMNTALSNLDENTHVHVSFDVDCLDPLVAPGVSTPEDNGMQMDTLRYCMARVAQTGCVGSVDLVELNPLVDPTGASAQRAVELLSVLLNPAWGRHVQRKLEWVVHEG